MFLARDVVVPACPGEAAARQQQGIGVQDDLIGLIRDGAENLPFLGGGIGEQSERLIALGGEDDL